MQSLRENRVKNKPIIFEKTLRRGIISVYLLLILLTCIMQKEKLKKKTKPLGIEDTDAIVEKIENGEDPVVITKDAGTQVIAVGQEHQNELEDYNVEIVSGSFVTGFAALLFTLSMPESSIKPAFYIISLAIMLYGFLGIYLNLEKNIREEQIKNNK